MNAVINIVVWVVILTVILTSLIIKRRRQARFIGSHERHEAVMAHYDRLADLEIRRGLEENKNERMLQEELDWVAKIDAEDAKEQYEKTVREYEEKVKTAALLDFQITS